MADEPSSPVSIRAEIPEDSSRRIVDAVIDLFSPVTEIAGALGDRVRTYRTESALRVFRRAKELAEENGLRLSAPPLKFLLPFIEKCSMEDDTPSLPEMWAQLLVSASSEFKPEMIIFADIISKITSVEARILRSIAEEGALGGGANLLSEGWQWTRKEFLEMSLRPHLDLAQRDFQGFAQMFRENHEMNGTQICTLFYFNFLDRDASVIVNHPSYEKDLVLNYEILESLGLIKFLNFTRLSFQDDKAIYVTAAGMTNLGAGFYLACQKAISTASTKG